ncbi:MAG: DNA polymerase III subunit alpha, partial [Victivallaceae bacterium]
MAADFVHLHLHTHYSLLDGACTPEGLIKMAKEYDMPAVAITDHGFMGGALDVYKKFKEAKINPIIGCEAYVAPGSRTDRNPAVPFIRGHHLVLLAKDISGYHSLCKLIEEACRTGIYYKPRIDKELLAAHHDGLIVMSACIGGEIPAAIIDGDMAKAERAIGEYCDIVGKENFYLEIMDHGIEEERTANRGLIELSKKMNLPLIATNDVHYLKKEHARAHEIMLCIQTQSKLDDTKRMKFDGDEFYFKSPDEMKALFKEVPEAITNTVELAERCNIEFKFAPKVNHYPVFKVENFEGSNKDFLRKICVDNIDKLYSGDADRSREEIIKRLDFELGVIEKTGFLDYFLVVADFISYARQQNIPVGPGRGSGAGSLVAYLSRITDIEPLKYNLLFERFLNPERISPPDFDIDFCEKRRSEVIDYVRMKYGSDSVCQIGTYGKLKAKAVIKDVARVLGHPYDVGDRITKLIPNDPKMTLAKARKESPELAEMLKNDPTVQEIFSYAEILEGLNRQMGIHAAGVIIGDQPLDELVPLSRGSDGEVITQFPAVPCESLGLLKMDFLGLRTLTIIQNACDLIKKSRGIEIDISKILLDDQKTYDLLNRGDTISVFQLESSGMQNLCRQFGVETIEHIIALIAIYRPGPMEFIPEFVACKRGTKPVEYDHPKMEKILKETYGIMLYQEQIMQVVQELAGFTLGGADILRRAIGKKDVKVLEGERAKFIAGCAEHNQIPYQKAEAI